MGNSGLFMPHSWNYLLLWVSPLTFYINWIHALNLGLASFFFALFMRKQGVGWAAIAVGLLTAFWLGSNLTLTYAGHTVKFGVLMLASVALYCISCALSRQLSLRWAILAGGAIGLMFLEQLDVALFFGFALGSYALFLAIRQWQIHRAWKKMTLIFVVIGGVGLLFGATTMLSGYLSNVKGAVSMQTESPREKWEFVTQWSWPPEECIDFVAPGYMGWRSGEPEGPYWGRMGRSAGWEQSRQGFMNFKLENTYVGIIPILLACFAVLSAIVGWKRRSPGIRSGDQPAVGGTVELASEADENSTRTLEIVFWGCVTGVTLLLAFGKFFPLYALFYKLPLVSSIRNPNKFLQVFQLALGILAAYGLDEMIRGKFGDCAERRHKKQQK